MTKIHAYRRILSFSVSGLTAKGDEIDFEPNKEGHVVADVSEKVASDLLLSITEAYKLYDAKGEAKAEKQAEKAAETGEPAVEPDKVPEAEKGLSTAAKDVGVSKANPLVFPHKGKTVDLEQMTGTELKAFAGKNNLELPSGTKVADMRDMIADALRS